ncbi:MAG: FGGY-family carbohydrate kinase [Leptolyngbyaceae cyanobacterium]
MAEPVYLGIDFGTSGARAIALHRDRSIVAETSVTFSPIPADQRPAVWRSTLFDLIQQISPKVRSRLHRIAINGTSATVLLCDQQGQPVCSPLMYDDICDAAVVESIKAIAPAGHPVTSASSSLAKLLQWHQQRLTQLDYYFLHQADWLAYLLHGKLGWSDYHNSLKLGYDPALERYPDWFNHPILKLLQPLLPQVVPPGSLLGEIESDTAQFLEIPPHCQICAGTTDSIAAFLASGATQAGDAVTSLGSTLVIKLLSPTRVDNADYGIYSHRLGNLWLAGGASNTGGAVLKQYFTVEELAELSDRLDPHQSSPLDYYPLLKPGERFPINDPRLAPRLTPRPDDSADFLHGLLESMARIELQGYTLLRDRGAPWPTRVFTAGGGAQNLAWSAIRHRYLQVPMPKPWHHQAAYGTALLTLPMVQFCEENHNSWDVRG